MSFLTEKLMRGYVPWQSYMPTWTTTGTAPSLGDGTSIGFFRNQGAVVDCLIYVTFGSTSTYGTGNFQFSLPVAPKYDFSSGGSGVLLDFGTTTRMGLCLMRTSSVIEILAAGSTSYVNATTPHTWATNDVISFSMSYIAA